jgi:hypothetical protein
VCVCGKDSSLVKFLVHTVFRTKLIHSVFRSWDLCQSSVAPLLPFYCHKHLILWKLRCAERSYLSRTEIWRNVVEIKLHPEDGGSMLV